MRAVLGSRDFRYLLAARLASQVAEGAFLAAVLNAVVFLPESQSTLRGFAAATVLTLLPFSLFEPIAGALVDRWPRRPILVALPLLRAAVALLLLPVVGAAAAVYAGTLVVFSANRLFQATAGAVVPRVVGAAEGQAPHQSADRRPERRPPNDSLLFSANLISAVAGTVATFGGVFAGGLLAAEVGAPATIALAVVTWAAASALGARLSSALLPEKPAGVALHRHLSATLADTGDGFRRIGRTPAAFAPILAVAAGQFLQVLAIATTLVVIKERLGGGLVSFSGLVAAGGLGVFLGFLTSGAMRARMSNQLLIGMAFALAALALLPAVAALEALTLTVGAVLLGASYGWVRVPVETLAQRALPDRYRGRVFTAIDLSFNTARVLGALAAVVVVPFLGPRTTFAAVAVLFLLWAPVVPLWLAGGRDS